MRYTVLTLFVLIIFFISNTIKYAEEMIKTPEFSLNIVLNKKATKEIEKSKSLITVAVFFFGPAKEDSKFKEDMGVSLTKYKTTVEKAGVVKIPPVDIPKERYDDLADVDYTVLVNVRGENLDCGGFGKKASEVKGKTIEIKCEYFKLDL